MELKGREVDEIQVRVVGPEGDEVQVRDMCGKDADEETNSEIKKTEVANRLKNTVIRGTVRITGIVTRMRQRVFCEIQSNSDVKVWTWTAEGVTITCARVFNPVILLRKHCKIANMKNLQRLEVEDPEEILTAFPKSLVGGLRKLESFSVTWTKIRSIPAGFYHGGLKRLAVQRNRLANLNGVSRALGLERLDASNNSISSLPVDFGQLTCLTELHVGNNCLRQLPESLCSLVSLRVLDCSCNKLESLPSGLGGAVKLSILDATANRLSQLPDSLGLLSELIDLRVASNLLEDLPSSFSQLRSLRSLNARKNRLERVPRALEGMTGLLNLNLRDNRISDFDASLPSLRHLNLNSNWLREISPKIFDCRELELLSLQKNSIEAISPRVGSLDSLRTLLLGFNPYEEVTEMIGRLSGLRHLDLKGTKIKQLPLSVRYMESLTCVEMDDCPDLDASIKLEYKRRGVEGLRSFLGEKAAEMSKMNEVVMRRAPRIQSQGTPSFYPERSVRSSIHPSVSPSPLLLQPLEDRRA